ncbi:SRPBCC family protein [Actinokineospora pegani]|uniref:SRPBCC family protein n=1 Tax=Actinokineospora pegani TaxID=2654637 RepID=UPI0012EA240F|nr:SRPBCC family protein [Actinokineospora pegani]
MVEREHSFAVEVSASSSAAAATLFELVTDATRWSTWAGPLIATSRWDREGEMLPAGVGAIRALGMKPFLLREETVVYEQDRRHVYALRTRLPVKDYQGEVRLLPRDGGGTDLVWRCTFGQRIPFSGPIIRAGVRLLIKDLTRRAIRAAER